MSITFTAEIRENDTLGYNVAHYLANAEGDVFLSGPYQDYGTACQVAREHDALSDDGDCRDGCCGASVDDIPVPEMEGAPEVNASNDNAVTVLQSLGFITGESREKDWDDMWNGPSSCEAGDFLGRVLLALAVSPADAGVPAHEASARDMRGVGALFPEGMRVINCGREPGYLQMRLEQLRELAEFCQARGRLVTWG